MPEAQWAGYEAARDGGIGVWGSSGLESVSCSAAFGMGVLRLGGTMAWFPFCSGFSAGWAGETG